MFYSMYSIALCINFYKYDIYINYLYVLLKFDKYFFFCNAIYLFIYKVLQMALFNIILNEDNPFK